MLKWGPGWLLILGVFFSLFGAYGSEVPNFSHLEQCRGAVFFLSTTRSGSNLISGSLSAITRKPISWISWGHQIFSPNAGDLRRDPSYNRLGLPLVSNKPLFYRSHFDFDELMQIPSDQNQLIFVTRNPKELLLRAFFLNHSTDEIPDKDFIDEFLGDYLRAFEVYDSWDSAHRRLVFYEDFIQQGDEILLEIVNFMGEKPLYFNDFILNKDEYTLKLLESYKGQHERKKGGLSSMGGPKPLFYSQKATFETLRYLDECIENAAPLIWEKYLRRFSCSEN